MTCPQLLRHSLACTARQRPTARRRRLGVRTRKGKRVPWWAERVQHPPHRPFDHTIELKDSFVPKIAKVYLLNPAEKEACKAFIDEHLKTGCILSSKSPQASPFFFIPKKDGTLRPCQDYRYLNSHTVHNGYPLPLIPELIDDMKDSTLFTKFDVRWGYNNIRIQEEDQWKAAFITPFGLYEPTVMFFGFCNAPPDLSSVHESHLC